MGKTYLYGVIGRRVKIDGEVFHGYKSFSTKSQAEKVADEARTAGHNARILPHGTRHVVLVSIEKPRKKT